MTSYREMVREFSAKVDEGRDVEALPEEELLQFAHAWENDKVEPMEPLVEKYGWEQLFELVDKST